MANMDIDGLDDLTRYFEKIGGDVEKVEPVALKLAVRLLLNGSAATLTEVINNSLICKTILQSLTQENPRTERNLFLLVRIKKSLIGPDF